MSRFRPLVRHSAAPTAALLLVAVAPVSAAKPDSLVLTRQGENLYLRDGKGRLQLEGDSSTVIRSGGWELVLPYRRNTAPVIQIRKAGKTVRRIPLDRVRDHWLQQDRLWGSAKAAKEMRRMHQSGGGVTGALSDVQPAPGGWVGIVSWEFAGPSGSPIGAQHLVRIRAAADTELVPVRRLRGDQTEPYSRPFPRLFTYRGLLLWEPGELVRIGGDGQRKGRFMALPDQVPPYALLAGRWLVRQRRPEGGGTFIDALDLQRRQVKPLVVEPPVPRQYRFTNILSLDVDSATLVLVRAGASSTESYSLLSVATGRRRALAVPWVQNIRQPWHGYLVVEDEQGYAVYSRDTLKLVSRLAVPSGR